MPPTAWVPRGAPCARPLATSRNRASLELPVDVEVADEQRLAIGAKRCRADESGKRQRLPDGLPGGRIPEPNGLVETLGDEEPTIRAKWPKGGSPGWIERPASCGVPEPHLTARELGFRTNALWVHSDGLNDTTIGSEGHHENRVPVGKDRADRGVFGLVGPNPTIVLRGAK